MTDIIKLLPDNIANQIAAGEVIQRPASVIKELVENAIDAQATEIKLIVKDAGKTLIQVIDNGSGMTPTDARMSFERHATSKIRQAQDLFQIRTMGFRGEALASIAAIAHVEMITKRQEDETGTRLINEGSVITKQEAVQSSQGTSIAVRNLFYNVPARRKFLKSEPVELRHILEEFQRIALAYPDIFFSLHHNGNELYHLPKSNLRQRIVNILGKHVNDKLIPIQDETELAVFNGFIARPEGSKKTKGDQYLYVNQRFIKSNNLQHAIRGGYEDLIPSDQYPFYVIFIDTDPAGIDINVHPTKTEIKFEDERLLYNYLKVSVKHALGQYSLAPMIDFSIDHNFVQRSSRPMSSPDSGMQPIVRGERLNPFPAGPTDYKKADKEQLKSWEDIYAGINQFQPQVPRLDIEQESLRIDEAERIAIQEDEQAPVAFQIHQRYIVSQLKSGLIIIDQQAAHERILYERYLDRLHNGEYATQKELFPRMLELDGAKAAVLSGILDKVNALGFDMAEFGQHTFIIHGTPAGIEDAGAPEKLLESIIEQYMIHGNLKLDTEENLARSLAISASVKKGKMMTDTEMHTLIDQLFACEMPYQSPGGKKCFIFVELEDIQKRFQP